MMTSLRVHNFRSLRDLEVNGLTRVSLLVGANNSGKTSVLEAAERAFPGHSNGLRASFQLDNVTVFLRIIEPDIEHIAAPSGSLGDSADGIFVKLKGSEQCIPLGSMGEGIKRLLALGLKLVNSAGGYLLVDEIDTGLHHSVMVKMWRLVVETAKRLDVQVLATTHSLDCVHALAALCEEYPDVRDLISLHRIERGAEASFPYSADELVAATHHRMELR
jgi:predicted ATP-dependent endonuclease of OLD family